MQRTADVAARLACSIYNRLRDATGFYSGILTTARSIVFWHRFGVAGFNLQLDRTAV